MTEPAVVAGRPTRLRDRPLARRFAGYGLGSVVAATTSEIAFVIAYAFLHSGTIGASGAGFVGGAIPNYILNRRWAWHDRTGRSRRSEIVLYSVVSLISFAVSVVVTRGAEDWARHLTSDKTWRVVMIGAAYLASSGIVFIAKFVVYDLVVFTKGPSGRGKGGEPSTVDSTKL